MACEDGIGMTLDDGVGVAGALVAATGTAGTAAWPHSAEALGVGLAADAVGDTEGVLLGLADGLGEALVLGVGVGVAVGAVAGAFASAAGIRNASCAVCPTSLTT